MGHGELWWEVRAGGAQGSSCRGGGGGGRIPLNPSHGDIYSALEEGTGTRWNRNQILEAHSSIQQHHRDTRECPLWGHSTEQTLQKAGRAFYNRGSGMGVWLVYKSWVRGELQCSTVQCSASSSFLGNGSRANPTAQPVPVTPFQQVLCFQSSQSVVTGAAQGMAVTGQNCKPTLCPSFLWLCVPVPC